MILCILLLVGSSSQERKGGINPPLDQREQQVQSIVADQSAGTVTTGDNMMLMFCSIFVSFFKTFWSFYDFCMEK